VDRSFNRDRSGLEMKGDDMMSIFCFSLGEHRLISSSKQAEESLGKSSRTQLSVSPRELFHLYLIQMGKK